MYLFSVRLPAPSCNCHTLPTLLVQFTHSYCTSLPIIAAPRPYANSCTAAQLHAMLPYNFMPCYLALPHNFMPCYRTTSRNATAQLHAMLPCTATQLHPMLPCSATQLYAMLPHNFMPCYLALPHNYAMIPECPSLASCSLRYARALLATLINLLTAVSAIKRLQRRDGEGAVWQGRGRCVRVHQHTSPSNTQLYAFLLQIIHAFRLPSPPSPPLLPS